MPMKKNFYVFMFFVFAFSCSDKDDENPVTVTTCSHSVYSGPNNNCGANRVSVPGGCCPSSNPWHCNGRCYVYCTDAKKACQFGIVKGK